MSPFVETIAVRDRVPSRLSYHQARFDRTRAQTTGKEGSQKTISLEEILSPLLYKLPMGLVKLRVLYGQDVEEINWEPYTHKRVESLALVYAQGLDYRFKYRDRSALEGLFSRRGPADDIIIVNDGHISDSFAANLVFEEGSRLITPADALLPGTCRARLLAEGMVKAAHLVPQDLTRFTRVHLVSAFRDLGDCVVDLREHPIIQLESPCP